MARKQDQQPTAAPDEEQEHPEHRSPDIDPPLQLPDDGPAGGPVGISNRPLAEEEQEQAELPPRGTRTRE